MDMTAIRLGARPEINLVGSATVCRSRVEPAPRDAAKPGTRDRRTGAHIALKRTRFQAIPCLASPPRGEAASRAGRRGDPSGREAGGGAGVSAGMILGGLPLVTGLHAARLAVIAIAPLGA